MNRDFDAIIVGAGPAGSAAAYSMAKSGLNVLMIERGEYPGSKNMFGGMVYCSAINDLFPNLLGEAPIERIITNQTMTFLHGDAFISLAIDEPSLGDSPVNSCTVLRSKFDRWMANKAEEAGAVIMNDTVVDELIFKKSQVVGVKVRRKQGEVNCDVVIIADGANSLLAASMYPDKTLAANNFSLGIKELVSLPRDVINDRFNLTANKGTARLFVGCTNDVEVGGFIYTNKNSLSVGLVCQLESLMKTQTKPTELIESFKDSYAVREFVKDGVMKEYSARLIPEGGFAAMPNLYSDGVLLVGSAAGLVINNGITLRGVDLAVASGIAAANTVCMCKEKGDMSREALSIYEYFLKEHFIIQDLMTYKNAPNFIRNPYLYNAFPKLSCDLGRRVLCVDHGPRKKLVDHAKNSLKENTSMWQFLKWILQAVRSL